MRGTRASGDAMIRQLEPDLFQIDHEFQGVPGTIVSYLLTDGDDLTLIETGPATTMDTLLAGIRAAGFDTDRITRLIVTHIHLDHSGGAGSLIQRLPRARLFVHRVGAPHMIDPSKLLVSATRIFQEDMERLWGEILPVPEDRVVVLDDEATLRVGDRVLEALYTPGHASHHLAFHDAERGVIFTGDVAGARLNEAEYLRPPTLPPEVDLTLWRQSITRLQRLRARRLYLTHGGAYGDPGRHFDLLLARLFFLAGWTEARLAEEQDTEVLARELLQRESREIIAITGSEELVEHYELVAGTRMSIDGLVRYVQKRPW
jgi:glyoxylase-like metal-dependent hydrolase (beta-lactamase superfamily II)